MACSDLMCDGIGMRVEWNRSRRFYGCAAGSRYFSYRRADALSHYHSPYAGGSFEWAQGQLGRWRLEHSIYILLCMYGNADDDECTASAPPRVPPLMRIFSRSTTLFALLSHSPPWRCDPAPGYRRSYRKKHVGDPFLNFWKIGVCNTGTGLTFEL